MTNKQNTYLDEGYTKYKCNWLNTNTLPLYYTYELNKVRKQMYELRLIGYYQQHQVGYGNISIRYRNTQKFIISATQTGHLPNLQPQHYALVTDYSIAANTIWCSGQKQASSEALTHAAIYELLPRYNAVIHVHHSALWTKLLYKIPTTAAHVPYGTPAMAHEIKRLYQQTNLAKLKILAMAGHDEGIISFGTSLQEASNTLLTYYHDSSL